MKVYQKEQKQVKDCVKVIDPEALLERASAGLLRLSLDLGLCVIRDIMEDEAERLAGPKGRHDANRTAYRHGTETTCVVVGGEKVRTERPRVRKVDGSGEAPLESLAVFQREDPLNDAILARLLVGVSTRKYARTLDVGGADAKCVSKSEVSRRFKVAMQAAMEEFFGRRIEGGFPAVMIDGMGFGKTTIIAAMGIRADGRKQMLGVIEGGSENAVVVKALLADLIDRGLDPDEPRLYTIDGSKALEKAIFGGRISSAYLEFDHDEAKRRLDLVAREMEFRYPAAAASLREGLEETLTVHLLRVPGLLRQTLASTNAIESANSVCAGVVRRVSNFKTGEMAIRQAAAGFMEAERGFRRIRGYREIPLLQAALASRLTGQHEVVRMGVA